MSQKSQDRHSWEERQITYFNRIASGYDVLYQSPWSRAEDYQVQQYLQKILLGVNPKVLDLGCGTGLGYSLCSSINKSIAYYGVDISPEMIKQAKIKWNSIDATFVESEMTELSVFQQNEFDVVISLFMSFSYCYEPKKAIQEIWRVLKPDGRIFISVLNRWSLRRILKLKWKSNENYTTRNDEQEGSSPARLYTIHSLTELFYGAGFRNVHIHAYDAIGGLLERIELWQLNLAISGRLPGICHSLCLTAEK